jgi:hypothetical protein
MQKKVLQAMENYYDIPTYTEEGFDWEQERKKSLNGKVICGFNKVTFK